jgi:hypothetical protein
MSEAPFRTRKKGIGCLPGLLLLLILGPLVVMLIDLAFAPWIYVVGGRTRFLPVWAGTGVANSQFGQYKIRVWFSPTSSGSRILPSASILGSAYVCTPTGRRYTMRVTGGASGRIWGSVAGHTVHLFADHRPIFYSINGDRRPRLVFSGQWVGSDLVMDDEGSIDRAFMPDGSLSPNAQVSHPKASAIPITFRETTWWWFGGDCGTAGS